MKFEHMLLDIREKPDVLTLSALTTLVHINFLFSFYMIEF